eukprot:COSAG01_NODE_2486_length_7593_cov_2.425674_5_plen_171_part_00
MHFLVHTRPGNNTVPVATSIRLLKVGIEAANQNTTALIRLHLALAECQVLAGDMKFAHGSLISVGDLIEQAGPSLHGRELQTFQGLAMRLKARLDFLETGSSLDLPSLSTYISAATQLSAAQVPAAFRELGGLFSASGAVDAGELCLQYAVHLCPRRSEQLALGVFQLTA